MAELDPSTRDLVMETSGDLRGVTNAARQAVYLRTMTHRGSCFWDTRFGSRLHELRARKITATFQAALEDVLRECLAPMLESGELAGVAFEHERVERNRWHCRLTVTDSAERQLPFDLFVEVG